MLRQSRLAALLVIALTAPFTYAQRASELPWMTGDRLVKLMGNVDPATVGWTPDSPFRSQAIAAEYRALANGEFVTGYIHAVHDASEGKEWCWANHRPKPDELDADVRHTLRRMSDAQLARNAADLIVEHWRKKYPCIKTLSGSRN